MTDTNEAVGAEALEPVQGAAPTNPQEQPEAALEADKQAGAPESDTPADDDADGQGKKKAGGFQRKIEKQDSEILQLKQREYEKDIRLQAAERELAELRKAAGPNADPGPKPELQNFESLEKYEEALLNWSKKGAVQEGFKQAQEELTQKQQQDEAIALQAAFKARVDNAQTKYTDFTQVITPVAEIVGANGVLSEYMVRSEHGPDMLYHLGKNPGLLLELNKLDPFATMRELTKLEARLSAPPPPKPLTNAPDPIKPVGARETVRQTLADLAASEKPDAYIARRKKQMLGGGKG